MHPIQLLPNEIKTAKVKLAIQTLQILSALKHSELIVSIQLESEKNSLIFFSTDSTDDQPLSALQLEELNFLNFLILPQISRLIFLPVGLCFPQYFIHT